MTYRLFHPETGFVKVKPVPKRERTHSGPGSGTRFTIDFGIATLRMSKADAIDLANEIIDAVETKRPEPRAALNRSNHAKPTPATPAWTSQSSAYNHPDQSKED